MRKKVSFETRMYAWSRENLIELDRLRNIEKPKKTYSELERIFYRSNEDIVNALSIIRLRKQGGLDPYEQIGSDSSLEEAKVFEEAFKKRRKF